MCSFCINLRGAGVGAEPGVVAEDVDRGEMTGDDSVGNPPVALV